MRSAQPLGSRLLSYNQMPVKAYLWPIVLVALVMLSWEPVTLAPSPGLDPSWIVGLTMATHQGLSYGHDVVFTYGPLGFLDMTGIWFANLGAVAFSYQVIVRVAVLGAVFFGARQSLGSLESCGLAVVVASISASVGESAPVMVLLAWMLRTRPSPRTTLLIGVGLGAVTAIELQDKISFGVAILLMSAVALLIQPVARWRVLTVAAVSGAVVFITTWLATGGSLSAIPSYVRGSVEIVSGYGAAMGFIDPADQWIYAVVLIMLVAGLWAAWDSMYERDLRQRVGLVLIWAIFWFFTFKEGIIRQDPGHLMSMLNTMIVGWFGFRWSRDTWIRLLVGVVILAIPIVALHQVPVRQLVDPSLSVKRAVNETRTAYSDSDAHRTIARGRAVVRQADHLQPGVLAHLRGHTVATFPTEIAVVWAYGLNWDPMPVFQSYSAYTPYLDRLNAGFLADPSRAPQRILDEASTAVDGRDLTFDQPTATLTMLCRYRLAQRQGATRLEHAWGVLNRTADRCSAPRLIRVESGGWGEKTPVPEPPNSHSFVFVRISGVQVRGLESLEALLYKPAQRTIALWTTAPATVQPRRFRFIQANAGDDLLLRSASGIDLPKPFSLVPHALDLAVGKQGQAASLKQTITYRFYSVNYRPS